MWLVPEAWTDLGVASELESSEVAWLRAFGAWASRHWPTGPGRSVTGYATGRVSLSFDRRGDWLSAAVAKEGHSPGSAVAVPGYSFAGAESSHSSAAEHPVVLDVQLGVPSGGSASAVEAWHETFPVVRQVQELD